jgi:hypothetical protein
MGAAFGHLTRLGFAIAIPAGCGFGSGSSGVDAEPPPNGDGAIDAPPDDADVDAAPLGPWGTPMPLATVNAVGFVDDDPTLTADQLELYFATSRGGGLGSEDIWVAKRASVQDLFGPPAPVLDLSSAYLDSNVEIAADGLTIVFTSTRGGAIDLWWSRRDDRFALWKTPQLANDLNSGYAEWGAFLSADLLAVVLCSTRNGLDEELYGAARTSVDVPFPTPGLIPGLSSPADECDAMSPDSPATDGSTLYFSRNPGPTGNIDIHSAVWNGTEYAEVREHAPLNTPNRDSDPWVSPDHRTIYFSSNRSGDDELYVSTR